MIDFDLIQYQINNLIDQKQLEIRYIEIPQIIFH